MNTTHTLAKILAVVSAMALASGYVAYRATGKLPWELHAAEGAGGVMPSSPQPAANQSSTQVSRTMIMPSSKSYTGSTTIENAPVTIPVSALESTSSSERTLILSGSKSGVLVGPSSSLDAPALPTQAATNPTTVEVPRTVIMSSSKSDSTVFVPQAGVTIIAAPPSAYGSKPNGPGQPNSPAQRATARPVQPLTQQQRTEIMSSSKSLILTPPAQQPQPASQAGR